VVVLDHGSGNLRSAQRALEAAGACVEITADRHAAVAADGLVVPGVGAFSATIAGLRSIRADEAIGRRLAGNRAVLGICVGMQIFFEHGDEPGDHATDGGPVPGLAELPGTVERLEAPVLPHMGWSPVEAAPGSTLFAGIEGERFYFVHSYAVRRWDAPSTAEPPPTGHWRTPAAVTWARHGEPFVAAVEDGPLSVTQFHPEKSGAAGAALLRNWVAQL
jgi:glutamine amidotransferase